MKSIQVVSMVLGLLFISTESYAQNTKEFTVERVIPASAEQVWKIVGEAYADIAKSHPKLSGSHYLEGTPKSGEGCVRVCSFNESGSKYTKEKMVNFNPEEYSFKAEIKHAGGLPLDTTLSYMQYDVDPIDGGHSKLILKMVYRTNPSFIGALAKGKFRKNIEDYAIAIEHYTLTGEEVSPDNFKEIKKIYL